ncbi:MAG: rod shape-determining protein MreC, partial [Arenimonas sp.]
GEPNALLISDIPQSADIRKGDLLVTSGMGGRFPAGFPVATVQSLNPNDTGLFMVGKAKPAARLDRGVEVLLMDEIIPSPTPVPPPAVIKLNPEPKNTSLNSTIGATAKAAIKKSVNANNEAANKASGEKASAAAANTENSDTP